MTGWEKVGTMGVDAGLCWVGDPCYIMGDDASHRVRKWTDFCHALHGEDGNGGAPQQFPAGVVVPTGYGDGEYDVFVKYGHEGRVAEVKVVFMKEDDDDEF